MNHTFYVVVFESTHYAIAAEKLFKEQACPIEIIPTPREITSSCGLSIKFDEELLEEIQEALKKSHIAIKGIYQIMKINHQRMVKQIL